MIGPITDEAAVIAAANFLLYPSRSMAGIPGSSRWPRCRRPQIR